MLIVGVVAYPKPPVEIDIEEMVPSPETIAVAAAPILVSCDSKVTLSWKVRTPSEDSI